MVLRIMVSPLCCLDVTITSCTLVAPAAGFGSKVVRAFSRHPTVAVGRPVVAGRTHVSDQPAAAALNKPLTLHFLRSKDRAGEGDS